MAIESLGQFCCLCGCLVLLAVYLLRGVWLGLERNYLQKRFRTNVGLVAGFACLRSATLTLRLQVAISHDSGQSSSLTAHHGTNLLIVDLVAMLFFQLLFVLNIGVFWSMLRRSRSTFSTDKCVMRTLVLATATMILLTGALSAVLAEEKVRWASEFLLAYGCVNIVVMMSGAHFVIRVLDLIFIEL